MQVNFEAVNINTKLIHLIPEIYFNVYFLKLMTGIKTFYATNNKRTS